MDFSKCIPKSDKYELDSSLLTILEKLEDDSEIGELHINSAYRTQAHEIRCGRNGSSAHCLGKAVDIACYNSRIRYYLVKRALQLGINRIGIYKSFVHLDTALSKDGKSTQVIWYG